MRQEAPVRLLAIFAHPDDESIMMGGTLAFYAKAGVSVNLLCATRGEWGDISDDVLATHENLGEVRSQELQDACDIMGVDLLGFLDCPDSNINNTDWTLIEEKIVRIIRTLKPQVVVTFGLDGLYGHPDHIAISMLTAASFASAADADCFPEHQSDGILPHRSEKLYYSVYPDFLMRDVYSSLAGSGHKVDAWGFDANSFGVPFEEITTILDVEETLFEKMAAIRAHKTQLDPRNVFGVIEMETARKFFAKEYFCLASGDVGGMERESDLFAGLATEIQ